MNNIFSKEEEIVDNARTRIESGAFESTVDAGYYRELLNEYQSLLNQMKRMVKMSDLMELKLNTLSRKLDEMSKVDFLTGLYNRRFFDECFNREWKSAIRTNAVLSVLIIDIDHFKRYNDTYGHIEGDRCLQAVASALAASLKRPRDLVARFGGEEFVVLLPETDFLGAKIVAESLLSSVAALEIPVEGLSQTGKVTVSIGFSSFVPIEEVLPNVLIQTADEALYCAKKEGRNCVREKTIPGSEFAHVNDKN